MAYTKTVWADRQVQKPLTFTQTTNGDGTITLAPAEGTITQSGTPITAAILNNLETQYDSAVAYVNGKSAVSAYTVGGISAFPSGVATKITILSSTQYDRQIEWANSTFTAKEGGIYLVRTYLEWASATVPTNSQVHYIYKNGAPYNQWLNVIASVSRYTFGTGFVQLAAGDTLEFYALQDSSGTSKTLSGARFDIARIS